MSESAEKLKNEVVTEIDSMSGKLIKMSDQIHANPEIGHQEYKTSELLSGELERIGFKVERKTAGMDTAFKATLHGKPGGPTVALLGEMDALAGIGHGCGHNIIGTAALGASLALRKVMSKLSGTLVMYGTPAEEGGVDNAGGKVLLVPEIGKSDAAMMVHPSSRTQVKSSSIAREAMEIEFFGKAAHAAGSPHEGVNALNAMIHMFTLVDALRQHVKSDVRFHGIITKGGDAPNIVPDHTVARFYARADDAAYLDEIVQKLKKCVEGAAIATGCTFKVRTYANRYENMITNLPLAEAMQKNWEKIGVKVDDPKGPGSGSTDMGNVSQVVPSIHAYIAIGPEEMPGHSTEFVKASASDQGHKALIQAAKGLAMTSIDVFTDQQLRSRMKREFQAKKKR
ncbi:MAG: M20 family metallopeptidase [archaeon]